MSTISAGAKAAICRTISEPMLPAEPVMSTFLPRSSPPMLSMSTCISSLGRRSSILTSLIPIFPFGSLFLFHSSAFCETYILTPAFSSSSWNARFFMNAACFRGLTMTTPIRFFLMTPAMSSRVEYMRFPMSVSL